MSLNMKDGGEGHQLCCSYALCSVPYGLKAERVCSDDPESLRSLSGDSLFGFESALEYGVVHTQCRECIMN